MSKEFRKQNMALKFFHLPKSRQFNIPYRFYDPSKEDREDRENRIKEELGIMEKAEINPSFKPNMRGQFRQALGRASKTDSDARRSSNIRLIILIAILFLLSYLFFYR